MDEKHRYHLRFDQDVFEQVEAEAKGRHLSLNEVVNRRIREAYNIDREGDMIRANQELIEVVKASIIAQKTK